MDDKWSRKKIKGIAKSRMKANYWKSVLVGSLLMFLVGMGGAAAVNSGSDYEDSTETSTEVTQDVDSISGTDIAPELNDDVENGMETSQEIAGGSEEGNDGWVEEYSEKTSLITMIIGILLVGLIVVGAAILLSAFIFNPLIVGCNRFFYQNLDKNAEVKEICYTFDRGYKNTVKTMFFRDLYTVLWSLLFIVPGIVKSYEYMLIPFLLSENENMTKAEAFAESKRLMKGNKWRAFVLDLSLIPWTLLSAITVGIAGCFYVFPYFGSIGAAFYEAVKEEDLYRIAAKDV